MSDLVELYGTDQPPVPQRHFALGDVRFSLENGALRHIKLDGHEAIRGVAFLVRDRDWGTLVPEIFDEKIVQSDSELRISYQARYQNGGAELDAKIAIVATGGVLTVSADARATGRFETNRAGFTVLHPIEGVAGCPVEVEHSEGPADASRFPTLIAPWQPFMDITALTHQAGRRKVFCRFEGDTFEMEDQRQWGDASYKTYNRPLAKPWPYLIANGEALAQSVNLSWEVAEPVTDAAIAGAASAVTFPEMALALTPDDALRLADHPGDLLVVRPQRLLCHLDASKGDTARQFGAFAKAQAVCRETLFDLELICRCDTDPEPELFELAEQMTAAGFWPDSVLICPSVDRQSTPPGSEWPDCPPLEVIHDAARLAFPDHLRGGGMVSFFPELNRKRPPVEKLDFVSHGLCPIVHAADDISVMETLEAVPHITASARAIIGDRPYRIGPATIAMRQNPYGERTIPNPRAERVCMADTDPRHHAKFGAAYVIGLAAALAPAGISVWTPAALYGPRGVISDGEDWPIASALRALSELAGEPVITGKTENGIAHLHVARTEMRANLTSHSNADLGAYEWAGMKTKSK